MSVSLARGMDDLEERLVAWAEGRDDIRAAIIVGSRARTDHPADEWADLDIALASTNAGRYHRDTRWIGEIANVWTMYPDPSGVTYHVLFEGGLDAGIAVIPMSQARLATRVVPLMRRFQGITRRLPLGKKLERDIDDVAEYYRRGVRIALDKDGTAAKFLALFPARSQRHKPPSARQFQGAIDEFWFAIAWTAKHLWRGELWHARSSGSEGRLKALLLQMIEWQARSAHGPGYDTWNDGRFLEEWADARVIAALPDVLPGYGRAAIESALRSLATLYSELSEETARRLGFEYSPELAANVTCWVAERSPA
jgi:aminoglycoside 6-adenylyltransferase